MSSTAFETRERLWVVLCLLLVLATLVLYNPISRAPFLNYDDDAYVIENPYVRAGLNKTTMAWAFRTTAEANWHPITWLSHELDVEIFGLNPAGPHYVNVMLHSVNVVLVFLLLEIATRKRWRSLLVSMLFAVHPINVESVAWISERKNVLSMLFMLLALAAYGWYVRKPGWGRNASVVILYALGLMTKPQVITLPFLLLLLDYWPLRRMDAGPGQTDVECQTAHLDRGRVAGLILEKIPLFVLSAASAVITLRAQGTAIYVSLPFWMRIENALLAYVSYLEKAVYPWHLAPLYPYPEGGISRLSAMAAGLFLAAVTLIVIRWRKHRYLCIGWFWFLGSLVPMIGLVQVGVQSMADRYAYIPFLGLFVMFCWGAGDLLIWRRVPRVVTAVGSVAILLALAFAAHRQIGFWRDNVALWSHTLDVTKNNYIAEDSLATALLLRGEPDDAAQHFRRALDINPQDPFANLNLGTYEQQHGKLQAALTHFEQVLVLSSDPRIRATALTNAGYVHYFMRQFDAAKRSFEEALKQRAETSQAILGLGLLAQQSGDLAHATQAYARASQIQPTAVSFLLLSQALEKQGNIEAAQSVREKAELLSPDLTGPLQVTRQLLLD